MPRAQVLYNSVKRIFCFKSFIITVAAGIFFVSNCPPAVTADIDPPISLIVIDGVSGYNTGSRTFPIMPHADVVYDGSLIVSSEAAGFFDATESSLRRAQEDGVFIEVTEAIRNYLKSGLSAAASKEFKLITLPPSYEAMNLADIMRPLEGPSIVCHVTAYNKAEVETLFFGERASRLVPGTSLRISAAYYNPDKKRTTTAFCAVELPETDGEFNFKEGMDKLKDLWAGLAP